MDALRGRRLELAATLAGGVTAGLLLLFLLGEVLGGDISGLQHVVQLAPLVALLALGWRYPNLAGALLLAIGLALAGAYFLESRGGSVAAAERALVAAIFLLPPILAGVLFLLAGRLREQRP